MLVLDSVMLNFMKFYHRWDWILAPLPELSPITGFLLAIDVIIPGPEGQWWPKVREGLLLSSLSCSKNTHGLLKPRLTSSIPTCCWANISPWEPWPWAGWASGAAWVVLQTYRQSGAVECWGWDGGTSQSCAIGTDAVACHWELWWATTPLQNPVSPEDWSPADIQEHPPPASQVRFYFLTAKTP